MGSEMCIRDRFRLALSHRGRGQRTGLGSRRYSADAFGAVFLRRDGENVAAAEPEKFTVIGFRHLTVKRLAERTAESTRHAVCRRVFDVKKPMRGEDAVSCD